MAIRARMDNPVAGFPGHPPYIRRPPLRPWFVLIFCELFLALLKLCHSIGFDELTNTHLKIEHTSSSEHLIESLVRTVVRDILQNVCSGKRGFSNTYIDSDGFENILHSIYAVCIFYVCRFGLSQSYRNRNNVLGLRLIMSSLCLSVLQDDDCLLDRLVSDTWEFNSYIKDKILPCLLGSRDLLEIFPVPSDYPSIPYRNTTDGSVYFKVKGFRDSVRCSTNLLLGLRSKGENVSSYVPITVRLPIDISHPCYSWSVFDTLVHITSKFNFNESRLRLTSTESTGKNMSIFVVLDAIDDFRSSILPVISCNNKEKFRPLVNRMAETVLSILTLIFAMSVGERSKMFTFLTWRDVIIYDRSSRSWTYLLDLILSHSLKSTSFLVDLITDLSSNAKQLYIVGLITKETNNESDMKWRLIPLSDPLPSNFSKICLVRALRLYDLARSPFEQDLRSWQ
eukprot:365600-Chlamydomonas_euryale.AAC.8